MTSQLALWLLVAGSFLLLGVPVSAQQAPDATRATTAQLARFLEADKAAHASYTAGKHAEALELWRAEAAKENFFAIGSLCIVGVSSALPESLRDFSETRDHCLKLARRGYATHQHILGRMAFSGFGQPKDEREAYFWWSQAAEGGDTASQLLLGLAFLSGRHVPRDYVLAYKWLNLSAAGGNEKAAEIREKISSFLTAEQISEGQRHSREFKPRLPDPWDLK